MTGPGEGRREEVLQYVAQVYDNGGSGNRV